MEISIRQDSVLDALVTYQVTGVISDDQIDAAIEALQQYQSIEDKNRQLRWALEVVLPQIEKIQRGANQPDLARKIEAAHLALQGDKRNTPSVYCLSLGWRVCREEYTDAMGFLPCDGFGSLVYVVRDAFGQQMGYSQISKEDAFEDAYKKSRRS